MQCNVLTMSSSFWNLGGCLDSCNEVKHWNWEGFENFLILICFSTAVHPRRIAALKALSFAPTTSNDVLSTIYEIVFGILDKVCIP